MWGSKAPLSWPFTRRSAGAFLPRLGLATLLTVIAPAGALAAEPPAPLNGDRAGAEPGACRAASGALPMPVAEPRGLLSGWEGMHQEYSYDGPDCTLGCPLHDRVPDPHGAVGPASIVAVTNRRVACYDKAGQPLWGPTYLVDFWPWTSGSVFDPRAYYDRATGRFFVICLDARAAESYVNLAVSKSSNPTTPTAGDWWFHHIDIAASYAGVLYGGDYPCIGSDSQALYITFNMASLPIGSGPILNCQIVVFPKSDLTVGSSTHTRHFTPPTGVANSFTLQPARVVTGPGPGNVAYFAEVPRYECNFLRIWALDDPLGTPALSAPAVVPVPCHGGVPFESNGSDIAFARQCEISTREGSLTPLAPRAMDAVWVDGKIWLCHTAGGGAQPLRSIVYYYAVESNGFPTGSPSLASSGRFDGGGVEYGIWSYMPALSANAGGDVCIAFTRSAYAPPVCPTIMVSTLAAGDAFFGPPWPVKVSANPTAIDLSRWGDFGAVCPDPVDDTFWVCHEWAPSTRTRDWSTWWAHLTPEVRTDVGRDAAQTGVGLEPGDPNPFTSSTAFRYTVTAPQEVRLEIFDVAGRRVATLVDAVAQPGRHQVNFVAGALASGVYFSTLTSGSTSITRRAVLIR